MYSKLLLFLVTITLIEIVVAFQVYDVDQDGFISNGDLFRVLKMMVEDNLKDYQLQQLVDKTIIYFDRDKDGKLSFKEFAGVWTKNNASFKLGSTLFVSVCNFLYIAKFKPSIAQECATFPPNVARLSSFSYVAEVTVH